MDLLRAPWVLATIVVSAVWYWRGSQRPSLRAVGTGSRRRVAPWRGLCFAAGLAAVLVALDSPVERLADDWFWAHMLQHVLLMMVAAPLLVLGAPWMPFWRPLPLGLRRRIARVLVKSPSFSWLRHVASLVVNPVAAWLLFDVNLAVWHVPALYDLTLRNTGVHYAEHISFVLLGLLFWSQVLDSPPFHPRLSAFGRVIYTAAGSAASWLLAIVLTIATTPLYPAQSAGHKGGLSPLGDQQLAAGVMLGPGSIPYAIVVFYWLYVWLGADEPDGGLRRRAAPPSALGTGNRSALTVSSIQSRRHLLVKSIRLSATLLVLALFALLSYRIVHGLSGARAAARMTRAITSHRAPPAPNIRLSVIWQQAGTWPQRLRASAHRGTLRLGDLRGYPVVLNFWASWCSPCQREAALLAAAAKARRGRVAFVGVDVNDLIGDARHFLRLHDVPYVAVHSGRSIANRFGLIGLPETFYVDRRGRIEEVMRGELSATKLQRALGRVFQN